MVTVTTVITGNCVLNAYWAVGVKLHKTRTIIIIIVIYYCSTTRYTFGA